MFSAAANLPVSHSSNQCSFISLRTTHGTVLYRAQLLQELFQCSKPFTRSALDHSALLLFCSRPDDECVYCPVVCKNAKKMSGIDLIFTTKDHSINIVRHLLQQIEECEKAFELGDGHHSSTVRVIVCRTFSIIPFLYCLVHPEAVMHLRCHRFAINNQLRLATKICV